MRIEVAEVVDPARASGRQSRCAIMSHLNDDQDGPGHQRPTASEKTQPFADAESLNCRKKFAPTDRDAPAVLAGVHVDGDDAAEWRLEQRQSLRPAHIAHFPAHSLSL